MGSQFGSNWNLRENAFAPFAAPCDEDIEVESPRVPNAADSLRSLGNIGESLLVVLQANRMEFPT